MQASVTAEIELSAARFQVVCLNLPAPTQYMLRSGEGYRLDLCLTPRQQVESARYVDRWGPHRFASLGPVSIIPPNERLVVRSEGGERASLTCLLNAAAVDRFLPSGHVLTDRKLETMLDTANPSLRDLLQRLLREIQSPGLGTEHLLYAMQGELCIEVARHLVVRNAAAVVGGLSGWRLKAIDLRLIEPGPAPTLEALAEACQLSVRQLTRGFRASRGCSIGEYRTWLLVEEAKRMLASGLSIKAIASDAGFASHSSFTSTFRAVVGVTPRHYRARTRGRLG